MEPKITFRHFVDRLTLRPAIDGDSVNGDHQPGAIRAVLAVDEDRFALVIRDKPEETHDDLVLGMPGLEGNRFERELCARGFLSVQMKSSEIDHCLDAHLLQRAHSLRGRLCTAIEI